MAKPALDIARRQIARRGADLAEPSNPALIDAEIEEAISVLTRDSATLPAEIWSWIKASASDRPAIFKDEDAIEWLRRPEVRSALKQALMCLLTNRPVDEQSAVAAAMFDTVDSQSGDGEMLFACALNFVALTLGSLFSAGERAVIEAMNEHAAALSRQLGEIAGRLEREKAIGRILSAGDFFDPASASSAILIGRRPRLADLNGGRFRTRGELLHDAETAVQTWITHVEQTDKDDVQLPVFWIEGRPGDGKSVLLLQLVRSLLTEGGLPLITELSTRDEIVDWLAAQPRADRASDHPPGFSFAFVDDFYGKFDRNEVGEIISRAFHRGAPRAAIITCGPTVERIDWTNQSRVKIEHFRVPEPSVEEMTAFDSWYRELTGQSIPPRLASRGKLLVEWLIELAGGQLDHDFAGNLKATLERLDVFGAVFMVTAVNALDIAAPLALRDDIGVRRAFDLLEQQAMDHLELRADEDQGGIYMLHPALVWPLFKLWAGEAGQLSVVWGRELGRALVLFVKAKEHRAARHLLGRLLRAEILRGLFRIQAREPLNAVAKAVLEQAYCELAAATRPAERSGLLRLWLAAARSNRLAYPGVAPLVAEAISALGDPDVSDAVKADLAGALIAMAPDECDAEGVQKAAAYLNQGDRSAVLETVERLAQRKGGLPRQQFVTAWIAANLDCADAGAVLCTAIETDANAYRDAGFEYVNRNPEARDASSVMWMLTLRAEDHAAFYPVLTRWMSETTDDAAIPKSSRGSFSRPARSERMRCGRHQSATFSTVLTRPHCSARWRITWSGTASHTPRFICLAC